MRPNLYKGQIAMLPCRFQPFSKGLFLMFVVLLFLLAAAPVSWIAAQDAPPDRTFGVIEAYYRPEEARTLGASWDRIIFHWNGFQPSGADDFDTSVVPQEYLDTARAANRQIVGLIKGTPTWASDSGSPGAVPDGLDLPYDDPDNLWGAFVIRLVEHYSAQGIHHWIIWNEPDIQAEDGIPEFEGDVADYFALLKTAYLAAKSIDPTAHIQIAGTTWWHDRENGREAYLYRLLRTISADRDASANNWYFDGISVHIYFTTSTVWPIIMAQRSFLEEYGLNEKQVWLVEFNASPRRDPVGGLDAPFSLTLEQQANFIVGAAASALASGTDRMAVFRLYDNHFQPGLAEPWGLVRHDNTLRPAFYAYQQVIQKFAGASRVERYHTGEATFIVFRFPDYTLYVMWSDTFNPGQFLINAGDLTEPVTIADAVGRDWSQDLVKQGGVNLALVDVPGAVKTDRSFVVVSGAVRILALDGAPRTAWFKNHRGVVTQLN
jgi:hypothetical protein